MTTLAWECELSERTLKLRGTNDDDVDIKTKKNKEVSQDETFSRERRGKCGYNHKK